jgi:hypothetical protein
VRWHTQALVLVLVLVPDRRPGICVANVWQRTYMRQALKHHAEPAWRTPSNPPKEIAMSTVREDYTAKVKLQLNELDACIDALESRMHEAKAEVRASYRAELSKLRHQSELVSTQLAQIKTSGEVSWGKMVQEMDKVRDAFMHSLNYFKSQF